MLQNLGSGFRVVFDLKGSRVVRGLGFGVVVLLKGSLRDYIRSYTHYSGVVVWEPCRGTTLGVQS